MTFAKPTSIMGTQHGGIETEKTRKPFIPHKQTERERSKKYMEETKERILAVDDSPANLQLLAKILKREGYDVRISPSGALALSSARTQPPDLILLDIKMPDMDGFEVCEKIKNDRRLCDIPVIFISALHESLDKVKAFSLGGVDYITKPFSPEEAVARVRTHLQIKSLRNRLERQNAELNSVNVRLEAEMAERRRAEKEIIKYQNKLKRLYSEMTMIEERERSGIATELHDNIGQQLALLKIKLGAMKEIAYENEAADVYDDVYDLAQQAIHTARTLMFEISPVMLYELGFESTIEWLVEQFQEKYGIRIGLEKDNNVRPLEERSMFQLFRTVRELLMNIVKHSGAKNARVEIRRGEDDIRLRVEDDGAGFDVSEYKASFADNRRFGLFSIRERLSDLGGLVEIDSCPGKGTRIVVKAPLVFAEEKPHV